MADYAALPLFTDAYLADCGHLSDAEHGRYLLLLITMWRTPLCRVPHDREWLARKLRRSADSVDAEIMPLVREFCQVDGNWITQKRLRQEYEYVARRAQTQSERAKSRWNKEKDNAGAVPKEKPRHPSGNAPSPTPTVEEEEPPIAPPQGGVTETRHARKRSDAGTRIDPAWLPDADDRAYAEGHGLNANVVGEEFRNYWIGIPGAKGRKLDWSAAFRNRCIQLAGAVRQPSTPGHPIGLNGGAFPPRAGGFTGAAQRTMRRRGLVSA